MKVKALLDQGMTPGEIADKLGTKLQTVTSLIGRFEKKTKELEGTDMAHLTKDVVKKMADEGMSVEEIAEQFMPAYPKMKKSMMIAKVTSLLIGKSGRHKKPIKSEVTVLQEGEEISLDVEESGSDIKEIAEQVHKDFERIAAESADKIAAHQEEYEEAYEDENVGMTDAEIEEARAGMEEIAKELSKAIPDYIIDHPPHYTTGKFEVIDYIQDKLGPDLFEGFCIGNVIKYLSRYRFKGGVDDLKKAAWYLNRIIKTLETA